MSLKKWSEDRTMTFIELYASLEVLWNMNIPEYKNKNARQLAYKHLVDVMNIEGLGVQEVKLKINNIRSAYCQEIKKVIASEKSGASDLYKPTVIWYKRVDSFLRPYVSQRQIPIYMGPIKTNYEDGERQEEIYQGERNYYAENHWSVKTEPMEDVTHNQLLTDFEESEDDPLSVDHSQSINDFQSLDESRLPIHQQSETKRTRTSVFSPRKRRKLAENCPHDNEVVLRKLENIVTASSMKEECSYDIFGKIVAAQLKQLSRRQAISTQLKLQTILTEQLLLQEDSRNNHKSQQTDINMD